MADAVLGGLDPGGWVADRAAQAAGSLVAPTLSGVTSALWRWLAQGCADLGREVIASLSGAGAIEFSSGWWSGPRTHAVLGVIASLAAALMVAFLLLAVIQGLIAGDPGGMLRHAIGQVPLSVLGMVAVVGVTDLLVRITDSAAAGVLAGAPDDLRLLVDKYGTVATVTTGGAAAALMLVVFLIGALLVWMELVVRAALVHLLVALAPLALAARVWPATRGVFRRLAELGIALIVSKFVIAVALALGAAALTGGGATTQADGGLSLPGLAAGATLMGLAAFTPIVVLRLLPVLEATVAAHGISRSPIRGAQTALVASAYPARLARLAGGAAIGAGAAAGAAIGLGTRSARSASSGPAGTSSSPGATRPAAGTGPGRVGGQRPSPVSPGERRPHPRPPRRPDGSGGAA